MLPIISLSIGAFAIGVTEFVIMGLLQIIAGEFSVSIDTAGWLITGYAFGVAFGGPILMMMLLKVNQTKALLTLMAIFVAGNIISAIASNYSVLMISRVISSLAHGCFFGIGSVVASNLVPENKKAGAIALMFGGLTFATIIGVPVGTFIGQAFGWRATFWFVSLLGLISFIAVWICVPIVRVKSQASFVAEIKSIFSRKVIIGFLMTITTFGGVFTTLTYISPILTDVSMFDSSYIGWMLLLFGVGVAIGNIWGGKLWDSKGLKALLVVTILLALNQVIFAFTAHSKIIISVIIFLWGILSFATVAGLQMYVVNSAKNGANLASTLNISAFNFGNGMGAIIGGIIIKNGLSFTMVPLAAAVIAFIGAALIAIAIKINKV